MLVHLGTKKQKLSMWLSNKDVMNLNGKGKYKCGKNSDDRLFLKHLILSSPMLPDLHILHVNGQGPALQLCCSIQLPPK